MRNRWNLAYWVRKAARWSVEQVALTLGSVSRGELFLRFFLVGLGIGVLIAIRAKLVGM